MKSLVETFVIGFSPDLRFRIFTEHVRFILLPRLPVAVLRYVEIFLIGQIFAFWLIFRHRIRIFVTQSPYEGFAAAFLKKFVRWFGCGIVVIVENHGDLEESLFMQRRVLFPKLYRFVMRHTANFALKHADIFRTISTSTRRQLETYVPGRPMVQFPTWTDIEVFLAEGNREKDLCSVQEVLYTGALIPRKGIHHLIEAFAEIAKDVAETRLVIIGYEENRAYTADLKKHVEQFGLSDRVRFLPPTSQANLARYMNRACAFVLPSLSEGLGRVVFEAMATGTPVIASDVGGISDMIEDGVTGFLVRPGDESAIAEKLRWVIAEPDNAREMGQRARRYAERLFSTESYLQGYKRLFELAQSRMEQGEHAASTL